MPEIEELSEANSLFCDPETGVCEIPGMAQKLEEKPAVVPEAKKLKAIYFTDPICSACWGIEPQLRKMKLEYGDQLEIEYRMGGLLPDFRYSAGGMNGPADVAHHWEEVSEHYDMPIDGDVWLEDPLASSYPPSIAFKAAQMQDNEKAVIFLRKLRELLFLEKQNIARWEVVEAAAVYANLDAEKMKSDVSGDAIKKFEDDLHLTRQMYVRGFPTVYFTDGNENLEIVYGARPYAHYEAAINKMNRDAERSDYDKSWKGIFSSFPTLTTREYAELTETPRHKAEAVLQALADAGSIERQDSKNGPIWKREQAVDPSKLSQG